ncbi:MAG: formate dehydrogenase subunit alpha [Lentisphaerae bacterium]|nr:formate dehydrogenase subunit alpha [Lentisphaerota bacterium]
MSRHAHLDGKPSPIEAGETILHFIERHTSKGSIPTLCYDERMEPFGSCRVCSVEVALSADGPRKVMASCHTPVSDGMHVFCHSKTIQKLRKNIVELVLTDYPTETLSDLPGAGDAELQTVIRQVGLDPAALRYAVGQNHHSRPPDTSHPYMRADLSKCINCYRCIRACDEIQGEMVLGMHGRGFGNHIIMGADTSFNDSACVSCGACAETCPTGAITDVFRPRIPEATHTQRTVCTYCGVGCNLEVHVKGEEILAITAPKTAEANAGHTCLKGRYAFKFQSHPDRLQHPLIRRENGFEEVSWDEAYDYIQEKLTSLRSEHGPNSIAGISSARCTNEENYLMQKFIRAVIGTNNIDCCARVCHSPTALGMQKTFGTGAATNSIDCIKKTHCIMVIGANPTTAHPVTGAKIKQAVMKGVPLIVIDPIRTDLAEYAQYHLALRPGTNVALLDMMIFYIIDEGLVDEAFVRTRCEDFESFEQGIRGLDIDALEAITGVDRRLVREAAIAYASAPNAMSFHGLGVTEHSMGTRTVTLIADLAMLTGNIGREGVGVNPLRGQNNVQGAADMGAQPHQGAGYFDVTRAESHDHYVSIYGAEVPTAVGYKIPEMFTAAKAGDLKALWLMGEDVVQTDPNSAHVMASLENLELLVVQEIFMTETAKLAHVILPATTFLEKSGTFTNGERRIQRCRAVVSPLEGTKTDGQIMVDIMNRMGYPQAGPDPAVLLEEIAQVVPFFKGVKWDELGDNGKQWPVLEDGSDTEIMHVGQFKRGLGKLHFYEWEESQEIVDNGEAFPFILTTGRKLEHYNCGTMTRRTANVDILTEDTLELHPRDARAKGISNGDWVRLFSKRGEVRLRALITRAVKPGVLYTTFHFPEQLVNYVTSDVSDRETMCPEYKVVAVDIERVAPTDARVRV